MAGYSAYLQNKDLDELYINRVRGFPSTFIPVILSSICTTDFVTETPTKNQSSNPLVEQHFCLPPKHSGPQMRCGIWTRR